MHTHGKLRVKAELQPPSGPACFHQRGASQMADLPFIIQQQMCLSEILVRGTWKDTETAHLVMGELSNASRCPAQKKSLTPLCSLGVNAMPAGEMWAGITASVFSTNHCYCFGTDSRLVVFHNPWHHIAFKSILRVTNVMPP